MREADIPFADIPTYETRYRTDCAALLQQELTAGTLDAVTFTSASTVQGFVQAVGAPTYTGLTALCIGEQTAAQASAYGMKVKVAKKATIDSMIQGFVQAVGAPTYTGLTALCIGEQTAAQASAYGMKVKVAKKATIDSMIDCLLEEAEHV